MVTESEPSPPSDENQSRQACAENEDSSWNAESGQHAWALQGCASYDEIGRAARRIQKSTCLALGARAKIAVSHIHRTLQDILLPSVWDAMVSLTVE